MKHLDEVPIDVGKLQRAGAVIDATSQRGVALAKAHPAAAIAVTAIGGGIVLRAVIRKKQAKEAKINERAGIEKRFEASAQKWNVEPGSLVEAIAEVMKEWKSQNSVVLPETGEKAVLNGGNVVELDRHLEAQRKVLCESA